MRILPSVGSIIDRLCVVAGAFICSQIPEFMQQYTHRLGGHVDELQQLITQMRQVASYSNKTLEQYLHKFISSSDPDFVRQGEFMQGILFRWEELNRAFYSLTQSTILTRPYIFLKELQYDIAQSTLTTFHPSINLSTEGLCYAGAGILIGWAFYRLISKCLLSGCSRALAIFKQNT